MSMSKSPVEFQSTYPTREVPSLPDFMRRDTFAGLMPGEINFPYGSGPIVHDELTSHLYIETTTKLDPDYTNPSYFGSSRSAIMRVYVERPSGEVLDGFIADMRHVNPGEMSSRQITKEVEDVSEVDKIFESHFSDDRFVPILAVAFKDPDGNIQYMGEEDLKDAMTHLVEATDRQKESKQPEADAESDGTEDITEQEILGDYYLG